ncbi:hypothetical protein CANARDRAFT_186478, partial [[Candida] arabinofermentans NRRL YB-2248]
VKKPNKKSPTAFIGQISSLAKMQSCDKALDILHELATMVAPILRKYSLRVGHLTEFFPKNASLLGLNVNGGQKICIRLRPASNNNWFFPMNELLGTMLHEMSHNRHGPHDDKFYSFMNEMLDLYYKIQLEGDLQVTGYISINQKLGSTSNLTSVREARLKKLGEVKYVSKVAKLGTMKDKSIAKQKSPRELAREASMLRIKDNSTCGSIKTENE